jgi:hypothetical protein
VGFFFLEKKGGDWLVKFLIKTCKVLIMREQCAMGVVRERIQG